MTNGPWLKGLAKLLIVGIALPSALYAAVYHEVGRRKGVSLIESLGIDRDTFNVDLFYDTLSPARAKVLGIISMQPMLEVQVVLISSSGCGGNRFPGFRDAVRLMPDSVRSKLRDRPDVVARFVGVAVQDAVTGMKYLQDLGTFDEVVAGGPRLNVATEKYFWGDYELKRSVPQIIVIGRPIRLEMGQPVIGKEQLLLVLNTPQAIVEWVARGAPIDVKSPLEVEGQ